MMHYSLTGMSGGGLCLQFDLSVCGEDKTMVSIEVVEITTSY